MNKLLKPIAAMFLAFALLLTSGGALSTVNAAENAYCLKFEYVNENGEIVKESDPIFNDGEFTLEQGQKGYFCVYKGSEKVEFEEEYPGRPIMVDAQKKIVVNSSYGYVQKSTPFFEAWDKADESGYINISFTLKIVVNTEAMDNLIVMAENIEKEGYSQEKWDSFQGAFENAKSWKDKVNTSKGQKYQLAEDNNNKVTQQDIDTATAALNTAIVNLKKEDLQTAINDAEELKAEDYKEEGWKVLKAAVDEAKALQTKENVTVKEIEDAIDKVYTAYNELEPKINEKWVELNASVGKVEAIKNNNYTEESWKALQTAIKNAKDLINTEDDVKIETVENAIKAIEEAVKGLKTKPAEVPTTPTAPATEKTNATTAKKNETVKYTVAKTTLKKAKKSGKKAQLTWKKVKAATGYEVY